MIKVIKNWNKNYVIIYLEFSLWFVATVVVVFKQVFWNFFSAYKVQQLV